MLGSSGHFATRDGIGDARRSVSADPLSATGETSMTRFTTKLLTALLMLGCGTGAMATPDRGQWTGYEPGYGADGTAAPGQIAPNQTQPAPPPQNASPATPSSPQENQAQTPDQDPWQNNADQDQDEDSAQTFARQSGQSHLGVMVMGLTPELRQFFGVRGDRGVLVARVEPNSAAARAGIQVGDVLVRVDRRPVRSGEDVIQALGAHGGGRIRVVVVRRGQQV
ncbi:MAG TPA: PDZ domain-containing protein, partial [Kofleriaceae bacterium]|nr:PDZ domain-containing protein [Kofleriaceae bacterium]